jgi:Fe-S cluster biosynthesis and repair protein YggX
MKKLIFPLTIVVILIALFIFNSNFLGSSSDNLSSPKNLLPVSSQKIDDQNSRSESASEKTEPEKIVTLTHNKHPLFDYYASITPTHKLLITLLTDIRLKGSSTELLLQLVEQGVIGINEPLRELVDRDNSYYTPLFVAATTNQRKLTKQDMDRFLALGASIGTSNTWLRVFAGLNSNDESLFETWINSAGIGPEHYTFLYSRSAMSGNGELAKYIYNINGKEAYQQSLDQSLVSSIYTNLMKLNPQLDESRYFISKEIRDFIPKESRFILPKEAFSIPLINSTIGSTKKTIQRIENLLYLDLYEQSKNDELIAKQKALSDYLIKLETFKLSL